MKKEIITYEDPKSPISEVFKTMRTNLQFMNYKNDSMSLLITSTMPKEGKSWITSNLGVAFAQSNKKVVIIDSDMRKGRIHNIFETKIFPGLSNYLAEENKSIKDYLIQTSIENLWIIPAGHVPPNPSELLSSERMLAALEELKMEFDVVLFDSTPCILVTDAIIISRIVDSTIIVTSHKTTKMENLRHVQKSIENVNGKIAGVVINKIPISLKKYKSKYYYYGERNREILEAEEEERIKQEEIANTIDIQEESITESKQETQDNIVKENICRELTEEEKKENNEIINKIDEYLEEINKGYK